MSNIYFLFFLLLNITLIESIRLVDNDFFTPEMRNLVRKIYRLSMSEENIVMMNILVKRMKNLIYNRIYSRNGVDKEKFVNISRLKESISPEEYGTYDIYTHQEVVFDRGY